MTNLWEIKKKRIIGKHIQASSFFGSL